MSFEHNVNIDESLTSIGVSAPRRDAVIKLDYALSDTSVYITGAAELVARYFSPYFRLNLQSGQAPVGECVFYAIPHDTFNPDDLRRYVQDVAQALNTQLETAQQFEDCVNEIEWSV